MKPAHIILEAILTTAQVRHSTVQVLGTPLVLQGIHHPQLVSTLQATRMIGQLKMENMTGVNDKARRF